MCRDPLSNVEKSLLLVYFTRINASKYSLSPNHRGPEVFFTADPEKVSSGGAQYCSPEGFQVYSADPAYMPLAWDGMEDR